MRVYEGQDVTSLSVLEVDKLCQSIQGKYVGIIYMFTNSVNGKRYVGQTRNPYTCFNEHRWYSRIIKSVFHKAICKYGFEAFDYSVLSLIVEDSYENLRHKLDKEERKYIAEYHSLVKESGYNVSAGGQYPSIANTKSPNMVPKLKAVNSKVIDKL